MNPHDIGQAVWELTLTCNLHCTHCGSSAGHPRPDELTTTEAHHLITDLASLNTHEVCLMGGEPFLRPDLHTIATDITNHNIKLLLITNGYHVPTPPLQHLAALNPHAIATSLDGATPTTHDTIRGQPGSHAQVLQFLTTCTSLNLPTTVITTINKTNFHELPAIKDLLLDRHIAWQLQLATPKGRFHTKDALTTDQYYAAACFIAHLKKTYTKHELPLIGAHCFGYHSTHLPPLGLIPIWTGCPAGTHILSIKSNGDITGCLSLPDTYTEGNIRTTPLTDIWTSPHTFTYNRHFTPTNLGPNCTACPHGPTCKGGCMGTSTSFTTLPHNDPYCLHLIEQHQTQSLTP